jgi:hypothetical protein
MEVMAMRYKGQAKFTADVVGLILMLIALPFVLIVKLLSLIFKRK